MNVDDVESREARSLARRSELVLLECSELDGRRCLSRLARDVRGSRGKVGGRCGVRSTPAVVVVTVTIESVNPPGIRPGGLYKDPHWREVPTCVKCVKLP